MEAKLKPRIRERSDDVELTEIDKELFKQLLS